LIKDFQDRQQGLKIEDNNPQGLFSMDGTMVLWYHGNFPIRKPDPQSASGSGYSNCPNTGRKTCNFYQESI
jgi:hypothetical protein